MNLRPGTELSLHYLNALNARAQRGSTAVAGLGMTAQDSPGGMVFAQNPSAEVLANCMRMRYFGQPSLTLPPGSLVHIENFTSTPLAPAQWDLPGNPQQAMFRLCDQTGRVRLGVLAEGAAPPSSPYGYDGSCPMVQYQGIAQVLWDWTSRPAWLDATAQYGAQNPPMHRLGARSGSPFAVWDDNGPLMIIDSFPLAVADYAFIWTGGLTRAVMVVPPAGTTEGLYIAHVAILSDRSADPIMAVQPGFAGGYSVKAPYSCLHFGDNYAVAEDGGDVLVTM